ARERFAPILMTALATGLALVPLVIFGIIPGQEVAHPMAIVILGGLVTSTVLNLFIVPSLYLRFGSIDRDREPTPVEHESRTYQGRASRGDGPQSRDIDRGGSQTARHPDGSR